MAANHNVVPGEGIEDVGPVRVMLESGITFDDVLYTTEEPGRSPRVSPEQSARIMVRALVRNGGCGSLRAAGHARGISRKAESAREAHLGPSRR